MRSEALPQLIYAFMAFTRANFSLSYTQGLYQYGPICEGGQWRKRYNVELEDIYNKANIVNVIISSRLRWAGHVVRMNENELPKDTVDKPWRSTRMWPTEIKME
jgi:hypothetical protein